MKKLFCFITVFILFTVSQQAFSEILPHKIYACSTKEIPTSALKAGKYYSFHSIGNYELSDTETIEEGAIVKVEINEYIKPKRGKRNGYAKVSVTEYSVPSDNNKIVNVQKQNLTGSLKLSNPTDKKELAKHAGISAAGHFLKFPGFSQAIAVSKGLINPNPEQNRLQSAGTNLYESTPLTYTEKGIDLVIEEDAIVVISVKEK